MATRSKKVTDEVNGAEVTGEVKAQVCTIPAPRFGYGTFPVNGVDGPMVIHRFSLKTKNEMREKMEAGKVAASRKNRSPKDMELTCNEARYISAEGWDGFNASSVRKAMISACRLVNYKMTLAKMSIFVIADGYDAKEPQIPLIRIYGKHVRQDDMARVETGQPYVTTRPAYHGWKARIRIRWDMDQFSLEDITNLLSRVGMQVGLGEGRHDSKNSAGMGWGCFELEQAQGMPATEPVAA